MANKVCAALGASNPSQAVVRLDPEERGVASNDTPGGKQEVLIVSESGTYSLFLFSRKPVAKQFRKWGTGTVLPEIHKTGMYRA